MKQLHLILLVLFSAALFLVSCSSSAPLPDQPDQAVIEEPVEGDGEADAEAETEETIEDFKESS